MICYLSRWNRLWLVFLFFRLLKSRPFFGVIKETLVFYFCISLWGDFLFILPVKSVWSPKHHYRVRKDLNNWISTWEIGFWGIRFPHWSVNVSNSNSRRRASFGISLQTNSQNPGPLLFSTKLQNFSLAFLLLSLAYHGLWIKQQTMLSVWTKIVT